MQTLHSMHYKCFPPTWLSGHQDKDNIPESGQLRPLDSIQLAGEWPSVALKIRHINMLSMETYFDLVIVLCVQLYIQDLKNLVVLN